MALSKRLQAILDMIEPTELLLDIGSDHGLLCIEAIKQNRANFAVAGDNKKGPLEKAQENIKSEALEHKIQTVLSDGALSVETPCSTWVIAGMGGELINQILSDSLSKAKRLDQLIVSPHSKINLVRKYLLDNQFEIIQEKLVFDKKYYVIIKAKPTSNHSQYVDKDLYLGKLKNDPIYKDWVIYQKNHYYVLSQQNREFELIYQYFNQEFLNNQF